MMQDKPLISDKEARVYRDWNSSWSLLTLRVLSQLYALSLVLLVPVYCVHVVCARPSADPSGSLLFSLCFALYAVLNMLANWRLFRRRLGLRGSVEQGELSFCPVCRLQLWRRDHHCFFLGGCVAGVNQLHFVAFCLHSCLGCCYATAVLLLDLNATYRPLCSSEFIYYFLPFTVIKWLLGQVTFAQVSVVCVMGSVLAVALSTGSIFVMQLVLVYRWKTSRNLWKGDVTQSPGSLTNFERAFDKRWLRRLIFPKISLDDVLPNRDALKMI